MDTKLYIDKLITESCSQRSDEISLALNNVYQNINQFQQDDYVQQTIRSFFTQLPHIDSTYYGHNLLQNNPEILAVFTSIVFSQDVALYCLRSNNYAAQRYAIRSLKQHNNNAFLTRSIDSVIDCCAHMVAENMKQFLESYSKPDDFDSLSCTTAHLFLNSGNQTQRKLFVAGILAMNTLFPADFLQYSLIPALQSTALYQLHRIALTVNLMQHKAMINESQIIKGTDDDPEHFQHFYNAMILNSFMSDSHFKEQAGFISPVQMFLVQIRSYLMQFNFDQIKLCNLQLPASFCLILIQICTQQKLARHHQDLVDMIKLISSEQKPILNNYLEKYLIQCGLNRIETGQVQTKLGRIREGGLETAVKLQLELSQQNEIREAIKWCSGHPQFSHFVFQNAIHLIDDIEILAALATFSPRQDCDPVSQESSNLYWLSDKPTFQQSLRQQFVAGDLQLRIEAVEKLRICMQKMDPVQVFERIFKHFEDQNSVVYADGTVTALDGRAGNLLLGSQQGAKQLGCGRLLRLLALNIHESKINLAEQVTQTQVIREMCVQLLAKLRQQNWQRSSREPLEQTVALLAAKSGFDLTAEFQGAKQQSQLSILITAGISAILCQWCSPKLKSIALRCCCGSNHQLRVVSKLLLVKLKNLNMVQLSGDVFEMLELEDDEDVFARLSPVAFTSVIDHVYSAGYPTVTLVACDPQNVIQSFNQVLQLRDDNFVEKLRKEVAWTNISYQNVKTAEEDGNAQIKIEAPKADQEKFDLILVSSLLDNSVNLGGIARTLEAFGCAQLLVNDIAVVQTPAFVSAAVTAEGHLNIQELRQQDIAQFLRAKQNEGYKIICLEQSQRSQLLTKVKLPTKAVVLIGNETRGVPNDLLNMCDVAVEIPQFGCVRSLNAHVSAALLVWEFVRQRLE